MTVTTFPSTPHINLLDDIGFGKTVLLPGDPLRARFIAENFLENPVLVNNVRGVNGHTGYYKGVKVSVMATGMGMPAMGIYSHELFNTFGVENIIRVGSAGSIQEHIHLYDLVIGQGACTDSNWAAQFHLPGTFAPIASWELVAEAVKAARANGATYHVGNLNSSDVFYGDHAGVPEGLDSVYGLKKMGVLALEMEAAALYMNAARYGKRGLCICTISDHVLTGEQTTAEERQNSFTTMMRVALDVAVAMENK
ncbi:MAG: purine-nucleoside phosphorylase [Clostridia bacterium]|nr:purine-nucleoside phosphorylase [Clostridia bacterium]